MIWAMCVKETLCSAISVVDINFHSRIFIIKSTYLLDSNTLSLDLSYYCDT